MLNSQNILVFAVTKYFVIARVSNNGDAANSASMISFYIAYNQDVARANTVSSAFDVDT